MRGVVGSTIANRPRSYGHTRGSNGAPEVDVYEIIDQVELPVLVHLLGEARIRDVG